MDRLDFPDKNKCQNCGRHLTSAYAETFGDRNDIVHYCGECTTERELFKGVGAGIDIFASGRMPTLPNGDRGGA